MDRAQVLLVGLQIGLVLVGHVRGSGFHLRLEDPEPELLRLDGLVPLAAGLEPRAEPLDLVAPHVDEPPAGLCVVRLVGAAEGPVGVVIDPAHEEVGHPEAVERSRALSSSLPWFFLGSRKLKPSSLEQKRTQSALPLTLCTRRPGTQRL